jgi:hypothetical protein
LGDLIATFTGKNWHNIGRLPVWMEPWIKIAKTMAVPKPVSLATALHLPKKSALPVSATASPAAVDSKSQSHPPVAIMSSSYAEAIANAMDSLTAVNSTSNLSAGTAIIVTGSPLQKSVEPRTGAGDGTGTGYVLKMIDPVPLDTTADSELLTLSLSEFYGNSSPAHVSSKAKW